jgi:hypothetical protein
MEWLPQAGSQLWDEESPEGPCGSAAEGAVGTTEAAVPALVEPR